MLVTFEDLQKLVQSKGHSILLLIYKLGFKVNPSGYGTSSNIDKKIFVLRETVIFGTAPDITERQPRHTRDIEYILHR